MADLNKLMSTMSVKVDQSSNKFSDQLDETKFTIFEQLHSLGYYSWDDKNSDYLALDDITSLEEILCHIDFDGKPDRLEPVKSLNVRRSFKSLPPKEFTNRFPYGQNVIADLHVAVKVSRVELG